MIAINIPSTKLKLADTEFNEEDDNERNEKNELRCFLTQIIEKILSTITYLTFFFMIFNSFDTEYLPIAVAESFFNAALLIALMLGTNRVSLFFAIFFSFLNMLFSSTLLYIFSNLVIDFVANQQFLETDSEADELRTKVQTYFLRVMWSSIVLIHGAFRFCNLTHWK